MPSLTVFLSTLGTSFFSRSVSRLDPPPSASRTQLEYPPRAITYSVSLAVKVNNLVSEPSSAYTSSAETMDQLVTAMSQYLTQSVTDIKLALERMESLMATLARFGQKRGIARDKDAGKSKRQTLSTGGSNTVSGHTGQAATTPKSKVPAGKGIKIVEGGIGGLTRAASVKGK